MSGSIDSGHCSMEYTAPKPRGWNVDNSNNNDKNRKSHHSLGLQVSPRQSVVASLINDGASLRWSTSSEASCYHHNQLRDTFEPLGLSAPPRAAFLQRCSHLKPPVFQPIKWRRSGEQPQHQRTPSSGLLSVCPPPPPPPPQPPIGNTHSMREFGQWSPTTVRPVVDRGYFPSPVVDCDMGGENRI